MSHAQDIVKLVMENKLSEAKDLIHKDLLSKVGTLLEEKITNIAPSMVNDQVNNEEENSNINEENDDEFELFVDQIHEIVRELEEETGEELTEEEILEIGKDYLMFLSEEKDLPGNQEAIDVAEPKGVINANDFKVLRNRKKK